MTSEYLENHNKELLSKISAVLSEANQLIADLGHTHFYHELDTCQNDDLE